MSFRINTNVASIQGLTSLKKVARETEESFSKLSSGERITKASDDAAGLAISEKLKSEIRSSRQANRNANDGISLIQVAEGGLNESSSLLTRMRELAIQSANDTLSEDERSYTDMEYQEIKNELQRISQTTEFNGMKLLTGQSTPLDFQVGVGAHSSDDVISLTTSNLDSGLNALGINTESINTKISAQSSLDKIDSALNKISSQRAQLGSLQNRLAVSSNSLTLYTENMSAANSRIRDVDYAEETAKQAKNSIITSAATAVQAQANQIGQNALKLI